LDVIVAMDSVNYWLEAVGVKREILEGRLVLLALLCFIALCVCLARLIAWWRREQRGSALRAKRLLTDNEHEFLERLRSALPEFRIWPQVAMGALVEVTLPRSHPDFRDVRRQFAEKIVDYVVSKPPRLEVVAVVELDDKTHDPTRDAKRDALLCSAGIRTVRFQSRAKPTAAEIRRRLLEVPA
jgi:hypothetical protein